MKVSRTRVGIEWGNAIGHRSSEATAMSNETHDMSADTASDSEPLRATRRTALQGTGLAGLLAMGVGSASASQDTPSQTTEQAQQQTTDNSGAVSVT